MHRLEWNNISFSVQLSKPGDICGVKKLKVLLDDVSGVACSGQLFAVIGPSGSGKTILLNILSSRLSTPQSLKPLLYGDVKLDEIDASSNFNLYRKQTALVSQDDFLFAYLTGI